MVILQPCGVSRIYTRTLSALNQNVVVVVKDVVAPGQTGLADHVISEEEETPKKRRRKMCWFQVG